MESSKKKQLTDSSVSLLEKAMTAHANADFDAARSCYKSLLRMNPQHIDALHLLGVIEIQSSNWEMAGELIEKSLKLSPNQPGALNNYGIALKELGQFNLAIEQYLKAINLKGDDANTFMNLGNAYQADSQLDKAIKAYDNSLALEPALAPALVNRAFALSAKGQHHSAINNYKLALQVNPFDSQIYNNLGNAIKAAAHPQLALECYYKAVQLNPTYAEAFFNLGNALRDLERLEEALVAYNKAIELNSRAADHFINRGNTFLDLEQSASAVESFTQAIELQPSYFQAYNNLGNAYLELKQFAQALENYSHAIELSPDYAQAYNNRANVLRILARTELAASNYERAIVIDPFYAQAFNNLGVLNLESSRLKAAIDFFDQAIALCPDFADAYYNKSNVLRELKLFSKSILEYQHTLAISLNYPFLKGLLIHAKMQICDWRGLDDQLVELFQDIELNRQATPPFPVLALSDSLTLQQSAARIWSERKFPNQAAPNQQRDHKNSKNIHKIRIGYFSADFRDHPVSYLMADLFEHHNRNEFEIVAFSLGPTQPDEMRKRLEKTFDIWVESHHLSDFEVVERSKEMGIDIAVDLGGFTKNSRTAIFAMRCAPVQISYIGYLGTMAAPYMDYLIADEVIIPAQSAQLYTEKIAYLPVYQANDSKRQMSTQPINRALLGLPENDFIFGCFNTNYKITPSLFDVWMRVLKRVESSILYLYADTEDVIANLRFEAGMRGIDPNRLYFANRVSQQLYLARFTQVDLFLDTYPYNAGTTASDALWSGLAVLTLSGEAFASRMAASLLTALGMTELITNSLQEYEERAVWLGLNPDKMKAIKSKLHAQKSQTDLFNTSKFTFNLEALYREMVKRARAGLECEQIKLFGEDTAQHSS
jgi:predicted O-linked N-acetylglucosamine transferase (SPINDLY family)